MKYWLMKSEPDAFSIDNLKKVGTEPWSGVRNYQARNFMRQMTPGDMVFFYHSSCEVPGIAGLAKVATTPYPDPTQFEKKSDYFDPKATREQPRWDLVDVSFEKKFKNVLSLATLKENEDRLEGLVVLQRGSRLSVQPVTAPQARELLKMAEKNDGK
jgi:predicted RNA-binding protein with PUA-like domain